jgi:hypothetical protein
VNIQGQSSGGFAIQLDRDELLLLSNALNEACNAIESWEFSTRLGSSREAALAMLTEIERVLS